MLSHCVASCHDFVTVTPRIHRFGAGLWGSVGGRWWRIFAGAFEGRWSLRRFRWSHRCQVRQVATFSSVFRRRFRRFEMRSSFISFGCPPWQFSSTLRSHTAFTYSLLKYVMGRNSCVPDVIKMLVPIDSQQDVILRCPWNSCEELLSSRGQVCPTRSNNKKHVFFSTSDWPWWDQHKNMIQIWIEKLMQTKAQEAGIGRRAIVDYLFSSSCHCSPTK